MIFPKRDGEQWVEMLRSILADGTIVVWERRADPQLLAEIDELNPKIDTNQAE
jgi:hypothetical protein